MTKLLSTLFILAAASSTVVTAVVWNLLTNPATMASALGSGSVTTILAALVGGN